MPNGVDPDVVESFVRVFDYSMRSGTNAFAPVVAEVSLEASRSSDATWAERYSSKDEIVSRALLDAIKLKDSPEVADAVVEESALLAKNNSLQEDENDREQGSNENGKPTGEFKERAARQGDGGSGSRADNGGIGRNDSPTAQGAPDVVQGRGEVADGTETDGTKRPELSGAVDSRVGVLGVRSFTPNSTRQDLVKEDRLYVGEIVELESSPQSAAYFRECLNAGKASQIPYGECVYSYGAKEYEQMRLFLLPNGKAGFALKGSEIVSLFSHKNAEVEGKPSYTMLALAISLGAKKCDCYGTNLPALYARFGLNAVARDRFNIEYAPESMRELGHMEKFYAKYNQGKPDIVYLVFDGDPSKVIENYDPSKTSDFESLEYTDYETCLEIQNKAVAKIEARDDIKFSVVGGDSAGSRVSASDQQLISDAVKNWIPDVTVRIAPEGEIRQFNARNQVSSRLQLPAEASKRGSGVLTEKDFSKEQLGTVANASDDVKQQKVFHGSSAEFDSFDHSYMGTGNQAYGWGTYVSESEDVARAYSNGNLYDVEIPDNTGSNYLEFEKDLIADYATLEDSLFNALVDANEDEDWDYTDEASRKSLRKELNGLFKHKGGDVYGNISSYLGSAEKASKFLSRSGFIGISYPSEYLSGGRKYGTRNYVIFDEQSLTIKSRYRFLRGDTGEVLGYFNPARNEVVISENARVDTILHELGGHATWAWAKKHSPALYSKFQEYASNAPKSVLDSVKASYPELDVSSDGFSDEVFAHLLSREHAGTIDSLLTRAKDKTWWGKVKRLFSKAWNAMLSAIGKGSVDVDALAKLDYTEAINTLVDDFVSGKRLGFVGEVGIDDANFYRSELEAFERGQHKGTAAQTKQEPHLRSIIAGFQNPSIEDDFRYQRDVQQRTLHEAAKKIAPRGGVTLEATEYRGYVGQGAVLIAAKMLQRGLKINNYDARNGAEDNALKYAKALFPLEDGYVLSDMVELARALARPLISERDVKAGEIISTIDAVRRARKTLNDAKIQTLNSFRAYANVNIDPQLYARAEAWRKKRKELADTGTLKGTRALSKSELKRLGIHEFGATSNLDASIDNLRRALAEKYSGQGALGSLEMHTLRKIFHE